MENFVKIVGHEDYMVNRLGVVLGKNGEPLSQHLNVDGYPVVYLHTNKKKYCVRVHRILATNFIPNPENKPLVNHIDGDKTNYALENLEWCTVQENVDHARDILGKKHLPNVVIGEEEAHTVCRLLQEGISNTNVAIKTGISKDIVDKIKSKSSWTDISDQYTFDKRIGKMLISDILDIVEKVNTGLNARQVVRELDRDSITYDVVKRIASGRCYSDFTKDILIPKEKRSSTIP